MVTEETITEILNDLERYLISESYAGYDPYDLLSSPLFSLPFLRSNKLLRFSAQQVFRRLPFNIRPLLGIKKEINPVTLGLCIQAYGYLSQSHQQKKDFYRKEIHSLIDTLISLSSKGYSGYCWGYNFDWEARYSRIPRFMPTIVATGIITNGLFEYYLLTKDEKIVDILKSSAMFVLRDLQKSFEGDSVCFSYSPNDKQMVYNATIKGGRLLAQAYYLTGDISFVNAAEKTIAFVAQNQNEDGSWGYSKNDGRTWIDNFHTAYVLDSLNSFVALSGSNKYNGNLTKGIDFYINNLFTSEGYPKYYCDSFYPIDATEVAQSIITLVNFNLLEKAKIVIDFALANLYSNKGYFYYRKDKITTKIPYIRWSNGWFIVALANYLWKTK